MRYILAILHAPTFSNFKEEQQHASDRVLGANQIRPHDLNYKNPIMYFVGTLFHDAMSKKPPTRRTRQIMTYLTCLGAYLFARPLR